MEITKIQQFPIIRDKTISSSFKNRMVLFCGQHIHTNSSSISFIIIFNSQFQNPKLTFSNTLLCLAKIVIVALKFLLFQPYPEPQVCYSWQKSNFSRRLKVLKASCFIFLPLFSKSIPTWTFTVTPQTINESECGMLNCNFGKYHSQNLPWELWIQHCCCLSDILQW